MTINLKNIYEGQSLDSKGTEELFKEIFNGNITEIELSAILMAMKSRKEKAEEISGAAKAMREFSLKPALDVPADMLFDTCGTGGDSSHSFNISSAVSIILNAMGHAIAKHGNRSVSSKSGSADFFEHLGIPLTLTGDEAAEYFSKNKFLFLFAPHYHPAMKYAMPVRKKLAVKTIFNYLGPLTNPAAPKKQMIGVFHPDFLDIYSKAAQELPFDRVLLYSGEKGMDEVSPVDKTIVYDVKDGKINKFEIDPSPYISKEEAEEIPTDYEAPENAKLFTELVQSKEPTGLSKLLALNVALAIYALKDGTTIEDNFKEALDFIHSGKVYDKLKELAK